MQLPPLEQVNHEPTEPAYRRLAKFVHALLNRVTTRDWRDQHKVPQTGGVILVANHISNFDTLALGEYLIWSGRWPRFLGKSEIFRTPIIGWLGRACGQIPVYRNTDRAKDALVAAEAALRDGKAVMMYPEGTITGDPDLWPMTGHHGCARLALSTGFPVVPLGQTGADLVLGRKRLIWPRLYPKKPMQVICGDPVDLSDVDGKELTKDVLERATVRIMDAITELVAELRGESAPELRYDIRIDKRVPQQR